MMARIVRRRRKREESVVERDLGLRLLKILLLRLYSMMTTNPLKWYEILIAVIMGALFGLGFGVVLSSYLSASVIIRVR